MSSDPSDRLEARVLVLELFMKHLLEATEQDERVLIDVQRELDDLERLGHKSHLVRIAREYLSSVVPE